jgi:ketosteroid isomerase-like protein
MRLKYLLLVGCGMALALAPSRALAQLVPVPENHAATERLRYRAEAMRDALFLLGNWQNAWARDDVNGLLRQYHLNALVVFPDQAVQVQGTAGLRELLQARLPGLGRVELQVVDAEVGDQIIYLYQKFTIAPVDETPDLTTPPLFAGTCTTILESNAEGRWRIRAQVFVPSRPAAAAAAASSAPAAPDSAGRS